MKSKEKCEALMEYIVEANQGYFDKERIGNDLTFILQDLEVLDQLKEILSMDYLVRVYGYDMAKRLQTYLKSNDIVKNWLERKK